MSWSPLPSGIGTFFPKLHPSHAKSMKKQTHRHITTHTGSLDTVRTPSEKSVWGITKAKDPKQVVKANLALINH